MTARLKMNQRLQHVIRARMHDYVRKEDGSLLVFGLALVLLMLMIGGLAVDLMRYEQRRTQLQQTADRSVIAAASLTQSLNPTAVVDDYFQKAGLEEYLDNVTVTQGLNYRIVDVDARADLDPFFAQMVGIDTFEVPAASTAEQRINNVEIMMVLDVSGSMGGAKIANLKTAAKEFVDTVKQRDAENRISITIVPYNAQVNLGAVLRGQYNATNLHGVTDVNCLELPDSVFATPGISRTLALPMMAFADTSSGTTTGNTYVNWSSTASNGGAINAGNPFCRKDTGNIVRLPSVNPTTIKANIDGLVANGNTSITLGMKWGVALLEPGARSMYSTLITANQIPAVLSGRPFDWTDDASLKVIILMTDGEHVSHTRVNDAYKTGISPIYRSTGDNNYSIRHTANRPLVAGTNEYFVPHLGTWQATPWNSGAGVVQQTWQQMWSVVRVTWVAQQMYGRALGIDATTRTNWYNSSLNSLRSTWKSVAQMDSSLQESCTIAKTNGVIVYGIAFEAPSTGQAQISQCSSSAAHYFDANGLEIQTAFRAIASNISQLRLTQ